MTRVALAGIVALPLVLGGCASMLGAPQPASKPRIVRPEAPPEYDYLVGRELEMEGRVEEAYEAYRRAHEKDPESAFLLRKLAEMAARRNQLEAAVGHAEDALRLEPDDSELRMFIGSLYRYRKDVAGAERVLRSDSGEPVDAEAGFLLYGVYVDIGDLDRATALAEWLFAEDPDSLRSVFTMADIHQKRGNYAESERMLREALERGADDIAVYGVIARLHRERGDRDAEIEVYREVLEIHPHHHQTLVALADALDREGRPDEMVLVLEELEREHGDLRATVQLALGDLAAKRYEAAVERLERVLREKPRQHEVTYFLGLVRRETGETDAAIEIFERIPPGHERYVDARTQIAGVLERRGEFARALEEVERARAHQPARPLDLYLASLRAKSGDFEGAVSFLEELRDQSQDDPEVVYNLGVIHGEAKQVDEALAYMDEVLEKNPDHAGALNYIGYTWAEQGQNLDEAEELITRALELRPDDGYITDSLGWVYYMRARPLIERGDLTSGRALLERAIRELERAAELTGGDPIISEHLGDAYLLMEEKQRALENYEEALRLEATEAEQPDLRGKVESLRRELGVR
jgi:tetratricopeptide (TPR) repeat protein